MFSWSDGTPRKAVSPNFHFRDFAISHDGRTIACFDPTSHEVVIWDLIEGQEVSRLTDPALPLTSAAFSPSGDYFAAAGYDGNVYLYDATSPTFTLVKAIRVHEGSISGLAFSPSTNLLAFGTQDNSIRIWDLEGGFLKFILRGHSQAVIDMVFVGNDHTLMSTGDFTLRLWNLLETEPLQAWQRKMQVREMVFLGERRLGYYEVMQPEFRLLDMHSFVEESILFDTQIWAAAYHERVGLAIGSLHGQLQILDVESQARTAIETNFDAHVCALGISPLGDRFVAGSSDGIRGWEKIEGTWDNRFSSGKPALSLALFGDLIAWGDLRGEIGVCRWSDGRTLWSGPFHRADIHSLEFSPDGTCLLSSSLDGNIHLRDAVTGELLAEQIGTAEQWHAIFSPGGDSIITTGRDRYVTVRDRHTLQPRFRFPVLNATGKCLAFSPSGRRLAASTFAGQIQAWEVGSNRSP